LKATKTMKNIELQIDQLILHGFGRIDRRQVGSAVQQELSRLIRKQGLPSSLNQTQAIGNINAGEFKTGQSTGAEIVGTQVAQKIYRGMAR
jgi:hypothetical protein